ncbi:MAG: polymerase subunit sigma-70 [Labilithrix sp.]|nr:polymerase subunit sigma-70 [Labilithrix sp.]
MTPALDPLAGHRGHLFGIAYRMLGSAADAEDVLQEAFVRWSAEDRTPVRSERAFLDTVVTRLCLDRLKEAHRARVDYVGTWLPEPLPGGASTEEHGGEAALATAESISIAFLVLLESLTPLQRAVHLLHDVFDYPHEEIARILDRDAATCRKLLERARKDLAARRPRFAPSREAHAALLARFAAAVTTGDVQALEELLAHDVVSIADGGGKVAAAPKPIAGRGAVTKLYVGLGTRLLPRDTEVTLGEANGWPALVLRAGGVVFAVLQVETDGTTIFRIHSMLNPDKLARFRA